MKDLVYKENPFLALVPKNESPDGWPIKQARLKPTKNGEG
jgi:hypothetical protein